MDVVKRRISEDRPTAVLPDYDLLDNYLSSENGKIQLKIPDGALPGSLIEAYNLVGQGRMQAALQALDEKALDQIQCLGHRHYRNIDLVYVVLALTYQRAEKLPEAVSWYERILEHQEHALVCNELAELYGNLGYPSKALQYRNRALALAPTDNFIATRHAVDLIFNGEMEAGIALLVDQYRRGTLAEEEHELLLWYLNFIPDADQQLVLDVHLSWGQRYAPASWACLDHDNSRDPDRKLRIGYLTADLYSHVVGYVYDSLLQGHDREVVEVFGYGNVRKPDAATSYFVSKFDAYRSVYGMQDTVVADMIRRDGIDILVATAGHTKDHRLKVMAYKPAPIQVDLGGIATMGMTQVDYRLTDRYLDPPEHANRYLEQNVYLPGGALRYAPPQAVIPISPLPGIQNGYVTFGSFNNHIKINDTVLGQWARVMQGSPGSRMILKFQAAADEGVRKRFLDRFAAWGIDRERITLQGWVAHGEHWQWYNQVDIALDTYPCSGCMTTVEALWMGVPTITLVGSTFLSRQGGSVFHHLGLGSFVVKTPEQYVAKAAALASNLGTLARLRATLRQHMSQSPLYDCQAFGRELEQAYRWMWQQWCAS
ncbi:hypothetical protein ACFL6U_02505 [Planctomycetota bacterium]